MQDTNEEGNDVDVNHSDIAMTQQNEMEKEKIQIL